MSDTSEGPGWWQASDGKWYPPTSQPDDEPLRPPPPEWLKAGDRPVSNAPGGGSWEDKWNAQAAKVRDAPKWLIVVVVIGVLAVIGTIIGEDEETPTRSPASSETRDTVTTTPTQRPVRQPTARALADPGEAFLQAIRSRLGAAGGGLTDGDLLLIGLLACAGAEAPPGTEQAMLVATVIAFDVGLCD